MDTSYSNIRKLRKKLRQIEHLEEIERVLTDEEVSKCMKKESIREELLELLLAYNSQKSADGTETDIDSSVATSVDISAPVLEITVKDSCTTENQATDFSMQLRTENINNSSESQRKEEQLPVKWSASTENPAQENKGCVFENEVQKSESSTSRAKRRTSNTPSLTNKDDKDTSIRVEWSSRKFLVSVLESHNDLITAVDCCDGLLVSASRDTTVKVWDIETLSELRSLGSHTGCVTDVIVLPGDVAAKLDTSIIISEDNYLILSGSTDCCLNVWLAKTGELLKSVYIYNPITKVAFYPDLSLVVTASDGGKLELWDINAKVNVCSETAHSDSITGLCVSDGRIYTSCAVDGEIKVFEVRDNKLHCIYASETLHNIAGDSLTMRHVRSLSVRGENIYYGDDGVNLKSLIWKKVFDVSAEPNYVTTLDCEETRRILDICCNRHKNGNITIVTAGLDLQVWKQVSTGRNNEESIRTKFIQSLSQPTHDSDIESDVDFTDSESEGGSRQGSRRASAQSQRKSWMPWCTLT
ncbi:uncharacterized protein LOC123527419 isoform X2 [Mercenaria mercenaria]|uniref:uncharacterized protein LOC123527419 isoform X2 n=1 Tax=Mercenaria mercenaria TaxID=6596 RepID=UPI00234EBF51|nr:uncharacterized protein LOC123527419 isoform X2 [Mercenaria mercenaria]